MLRASGYEFVFVKDDYYLLVGGCGKIGDWFLEEGVGLDRSETFCCCFFSLPLWPSLAKHVPSQ